MILAIDIGNTNINFALIDNRGRIRKRGTVPAKNGDGSNVFVGAYCNTPLRCRQNRPQNVDKIIIVTVVPKALKKLERALRKNFSRAEISIVGRDVKVPLKCNYRKDEIGQDRLVTAYAAKSLYGAPALIIDFGTAVTFDAVSRNGTYMGGLILPGIKMSLESLAERTAMLPKTYLKKTRAFIGKNTRASIRGGMIYGYASMCDGLVALFRKKIGKNLKIIATGGDAPLISHYTATVKKVDLNLSIKGLYLLAKSKN